MKFRPEVTPFLLASALLGAVVFFLMRTAGRPNGSALSVGLVVAGILAAYMLFFFRDPEMTTPNAPDIVVAAASGKLAKIAEVYEGEYLKTETIRVSIFLSLFDVHVNRFPISGQSTFLGYFPGKRLFTFQEKSSDVNQHNAILVEGEGTRCLIRQIVGPVCRRVVYWPPSDRAVPVKRGERFGMMKFGSRLDMYFPKGDIEMTATIGQQITAGETVLARLVRREVM